jgi:signal transduction histidine kinase
MVQRGEAPRVNGTYPAEVQPLVDDLNRLLADRDARLAGAIAAAGDLAHELKTPLAVLARDAERPHAAGAEARASERAEQIDRMRRVIDYHLAGARASAAAHLPGVRCDLASAVDGLLRTVARLYSGRGLHFEAAVPSTHAVRCQRDDVEEMLGNLLDNACKWSRTRVQVASRLVDAQCVVTVDDDGAGLDPSLAQAVLERGVRADQRVPGTGLGLAIVRQLADVYGGAIVLVPSPLGGVRAQLSLPAVASSPQGTHDSENTPSLSPNRLMS